MSAARPLKRGTAGATPLSPQPCVGIRTYLRRHDYYMATGMGEADGAIVERVLAGDRDAFGILIELPVWSMRPTRCQPWRRRPSGRGSRRGAR
jgi:hypothetical protein